jgi:hypothetical protein
MIKGVLSFIVLAIAMPMADAASTDEVPETVMITYHAKSGSEDELARVIASHWSVARHLRLVRKEPHVTLRGSEGAGLTYFVEILTWRDGNIPDFAPPAIQKLWDQMNALVESRDGKPGLDFASVEVISDRSAASRSTAAPTDGARPTATPTAALSIAARRTAPLSKLPGEDDTGIAGID